MVTDYKMSCGYSVGTLKDFIYLIPYSPDRFSYSVDNGDCSEVDMNESGGIIRIDGFQATLKNEESYSGRFKFESEVSIYIHELLGQNLRDRMGYLINNRWFVVVEDIRGVQYIQSVEFYSEFKYNLSITDQNNAQNRIQLRFLGSSNFPTMIMGKNITKDMTTPLFNSTCRYISGGVSDLRMCEHEWVVIKESNHEVEKISTTGGKTFKGIDFMRKSFTYSQTYDGGKFEDTITFSIPLSDYKHYWHYNLIEFKENRYVVSFRTANDNMYIIGYSDGAFPSYVIETSTAVNSLNKITITLRYISEDGFFISSKDDSVFDVDKSIVWKPAPDTVGGVFTKECQSSGKAYIILIQKYTASGAALDEYMVLEGYADRFPNLNIIGQYSLTDDIGFPIEIDDADCGGGNCGTVSGITNPYSLSKYNTSYNIKFTSNCDYTFQNVPSWLTVTKNDDGVTISLNENIPSTDTDAILYIVTHDGVRYPIIVSYTATSDTTGWDVLPREIYISHDKQNVTVKYSGNVTPSTLGFSSDTLRLVNIGNGKIIVEADENNTSSVINHTFIVTNKSNGESVTVKVIQSTVNEDWRLVDGYICDNGDKYTKLELYIGGKATMTYKKGTLVESGSADCRNVSSRWIQYDTICDGVNEYTLMKEQSSSDGGNTWTDTGQTERGSLVEENSEKCNPDHVKWKNSGNTICQGGKKCEVWEKYIDDVATAETEARNCVVDETVCPIEYPTKWELSTQSQCVDRGDGICDSWYLNEEFISYDGGATWESLGIFEVSDQMKLKDDYDCNCPKHDKYRYERWTWDGKGFLCDDSSYDCKIEALWIPYGFKKTSMGGYWDDKTITNIEAPCDTSSMKTWDNFAKNCESLKHCDELDVKNAIGIKYMFYNCLSLEKLPVTDISGVDSCAYAFYNTPKMKGKGKGGSKGTGKWGVMTLDYMFYNSGIEEWDFEGGRVKLKPVGVITNSKIKKITGLNYDGLSAAYIDAGQGNDADTSWESDVIETLEIKNIGISFSFRMMPNLSKESMLYMYNNASSSDEMKWYYNSQNLSKWGSLPNTKSNITWVKNN